MNYRCCVPEVQKSEIKVSHYINLINEMSTAQKIEKWAKWIQIIRDEVAYLAWSCNIYSETRQIVTDNPKISTFNHFYEWITRSHVHTTLMGIRRQLDSHCGTVSLENLLRDMRDNCNLLTRKQYGF